PALQFNGGLEFHASDNPAFLWFSKKHPVRSAGAGGAEGRVLVVANTDPHWLQHGHVQVPIWDLGIAPYQSYVVEDLLDNTRYSWRGDWNYVKLDPAERMAHIFVIRDV